MNGWLEALALSGGFLGWAALLVWSAGKMSTELRYVRNDLNDFKRSVEKATDALATTLIAHEGRISRVEGRLSGGNL